MEGGDSFERYVKHFMGIQFPAGDVPLWIVDALSTADINITSTITSQGSSSTSVSIADSDDPATKMMKLGD